MLKLILATLSLITVGNAGLLNKRMMASKRVVDEEGLRQLSDPTYPSPTEEMIADSPISGYDATNYRYCYEQGEYLTTSSDGKTIDPFDSDCAESEYTCNYQYMHACQEGRHEPVGGGVPPVVIVILVVVVGGFICLIGFSALPQK